MLLDGEHLLTEALRTDLTIDFVLSDGRHAGLAKQAAARGTLVHPCTRSVLEAASPVRTPSGILAVARWAPASLDALLGAPRVLALGLVDVQDPGNAGAAIRSADALGATGVAMLGETTHPAGWKVLRGSMGSVFRLPIAQGRVADALDLATRHAIQVVATVPATGSPPDVVDFRRASLILLGQEGSGLPQEIVARADATLTIAMRPGIDSLNIAVAGALILDEARRQRQTGRSV
jgi:TrmH family RNA methyltransferase